LKANSKHHQQENITTQNILISDFQNLTPNYFTNINTNLTLIQQIPEQKSNVSIDSIFINQKNNTSFIVNATIKNQGDIKKDIPIALFNDDKLLSKQTFSIDNDETKKIAFTVEKTASFLGKLVISFEDAFSHDNEFFFTINSQQKTNVLCIGDTNDFLSRIYTKSEFNFTSATPKNVNYNNLEKQQLIILNELEKIPVTLQTSLIDFSKKGGQLILIPSAKTDTASYNLLFKNLSIGNISLQKKDSLKITNINFKHPLFKDVFNKKVSNFQYPNIKSYYPDTFKNTSNLISFENNEGFIKQVNLTNSKLFWVASPLNKSNSNFTNSPLIVPVFYNIGQQSLQLSKLNYFVNELNTIEIQALLGKDDIITIQNKNTSFIPLQQNNQNKITITTKEQPLKNGFYTILYKKDTLNNIAFNYTKEDGFLKFLDAKKIAKDNNNLQFSSSIKDFLYKINKKNKVQWLWKWFLIIIDATSSFNNETKDILIVNGIIKEISNNISTKKNYTVVELDNLHVSTGWFDTSVSFGEPGYEERETIENGLKVASKSGFTAVAVNPNTNPIIHNKTSIEFVKNKALSSATNLYPIGALTQESKGIEMAELYDMQQSGAIAFGDYNKPIENDNLLKVALLYAQNFDGLIFSFPKNKKIASEGVAHEGVNSTKLGLKGIPALAEELQISRDLFLLEYTGGKLHVPTISTEKSVKLIKDAKKKGLNVSCSVAIHNLILTDDELEGFEANKKVNPPLRTTKDTRALLKGLKDGTIDIITSDHNPIDIEYKKVEFSIAKDGTIGLESAFGALATVLDTATIVKCLSENPKKRFGVETSSIDVNQKADITLFNTEGKTIFSEIDIISASKNSVFLGKELKGKAYGVINNNQLILNI